MEKIFINTLLAMLLGAAIGLKGEIDRKYDGESIIGGFRTHAFLALLGAISGAFILSGNYLLPALLTGTVMLLVVGYYVSGLVNKAYGITDEISAIFAHFVGILLVLEPVSVKYIVAITVLIVFIITRKAEIRKVTQKISRQEIAEFRLFAIIALAVLPYLPNQGYSLVEIFSTDITSYIPISGFEKIVDLEIINPFKTWFIVVFVSGIDLAGYLMTKFLSSGNSKFIFAAIGGFVSSTSTTISLAIQSKDTPIKEKINKLVAAALGANASSFIQILILVAPISIVLFQKILIPTLLMIIGGFTLALIINTYNEKIIGKELELDTKKGSIFKIGPALKFALLLTVVKFIANTSLIYLGNSAFIFTSMIAALTGVDAIMITLSEMVNTDQIGLDLAFITFMAANFVNLSSKVVYSFISGRKYFATRFGLYIGAVFILSFLTGLI